MIKLITQTDLETVALLHRDYYGRKILSYFRAYGCEYDFCRFYSVTDDGQEGYIVHFNSIVIITGENELPYEELSHFISMNAPFRVEAPGQILNNLPPLSGYKVLKRTEFAFTDHKPDEFDLSRLDESPALDDVYEILHEGFPTLTQYQLWITEHSHKIRRGLSRIYMYNECTTATVIYDVDDNVLIGQVATKTQARGKGYARELLYWIGHYLSQHGKTVRLFALDYRESFYREIGFTPISTENVLQEDCS
ncbi:MAG: GNAT family N-acetyltransferase [Oscillospiraceae bacterium]|nr:GNAT family N-acetyltransferase [Oscillospiraceae bacterium]